MKAVKASIYPALALLAGLAACSNRAPDASFNVAFHATGDDHAPLAAAVLSVRGKRVGVTDAAGTLEVRLAGVDGESVAVKVTCPVGYVAPEHLPPLKLAHTRNIAGGAPVQVPYALGCTRKLREIALVVHSENQPDLPVLLQGRPIGVTDQQGNLQLLVPLERDVRTLELGIDTSARPELVPKSPTRTVALETSGDEIVTFDQEFTEPEKPRLVRAAAAPVRHIPTRLE